jgi:hypothetical protein
MSQSPPDAADRCAEFIRDIVEVCKKHRVMLKVDNEYEFAEFEFQEYPADTGDPGFILGSKDIEEVIRVAVWDVVHPTEYRFEPTAFGFRRMPAEFAEYWGNGEKWYKVTSKNDTNFWFTVCRKVIADRWDDQWQIYSAVATNDATGRETTSSSVVFTGCISSQQFAELLLSHVMGTYRNAGVEEGKKRLEAAFLEYE